ncbi:MAG TPA: 3-oxoacyl-ACP reductase FabG [Solirubrobacteraceae bacterium]|nr:3-oxoacyl-ACP reductase FabG [Solirubrobacteraceae bacterium]
MPDPAVAAPGAWPPEGCALVTGASRGIGAAIARGLAADGWPVAVGYQSGEEAAERVVADIAAAGGRAVAVPGDVTAPDAPEQVIQTAEGALGGPLLALVNNAGITRDNLAPSLTDEEWDAVIQTNLTAAFRFTRRALKGMMRARTGRIVNIASVSGLRANPGQSNYAAAKAGLVQFTRTAAVEVARRGVTINAVAPGFIATDMTAELITPELLAAIPAKRAGTPEEVAACVRFLVSQEAGYVTGAVLTVDGGLAA